MMFAKLKRLMSGIEQAASLGARCSELEKANAELKERNAALWDSYNKKNEHAQALTGKLEEVTAKVREQTEADLVLTSIRIIDGALRGKKKEELSPLTSIQQQQMAAMQAMAPNYGGYGGYGVLGGLGRIYP